MYRNMLAAAVKANGKFLREFGDKVYVPFGQEYSLFIRNMASVRAQVKVSIDDQDVLNGSSLVVDSNGSINIERYLKDLDKGNKFKFIERTKSVEDHRGAKVADGLIRIEFQFERKVYPTLYRNPPVWSDPGYKPEHTWYGTRLGGQLWNGTYEKSFTTCAVGQTATSTDSTFASSSVTRGLATNDVGITVPGSESNQKFQVCSGFPLQDEVNVMVIQLLGETEDRKIEAPVIVKRNVECVTCGRKNKQKNKFCAECGTALEVI